MDKIIEEKYCTGCNTCSEKCPQNAIQLKQNSFGFYYPKINNDLCINCRVCLNVCPQLQKRLKKTPLKYLAVKVKNEEIRDLSSSGGVFYYLAKHVIQNGGIVVGAAFVEKKVKHIVIDDIQKIKLLQKSKYVQSNIHNLYSKIEKLLNQNKTVLFSGTPCQIAGLYNFLNIKYDNLITCEVLCHGVSSPKLFDEYCCYMEDKYKSKIMSYNFRYKDKYSLTNTQIIFDDNQIYTSLNDPYHKIFLNYNFRESCVNCHYKDEQRISDLTIGDFQDHQNILGYFDDDKGISLLLINNEVGLRCFQNISKYYDIYECKSKECYQPALGMIKTIFNKEDYFTFWNEYNENGFEFILDKYGKISNKQKLYSIIRKLLINVHLWKRIKKH